MYQDIFANELEVWRGRGARVVDVREPFEYAQGHIPGAENIPLERIPVYAGEMRGPLVLVCASGGRSAQAAEYLARRGLVEVANLPGGTAG